MEYFFKTNFLAFEKTATFRENFEEVLGNGSHFLRVFLLIIDTISVQEYSLLMVKPGKKNAKSQLICLVNG